MNSVCLRQNFLIPHVRHEPPYAYWHAHIRSCLHAHVYMIWRGASNLWLTHDSLRTVDRTLNYRTNVGQSVWNTESAG